MSPTHNDEWGVCVSEMGKGAGRQRIIRDIETVDEAVKAEKDVEEGFHRAIEENLVTWLATEEDIIESYSKLMKKSENPHVTSVFSDIMKDSQNHIAMLTSIKKDLEKIVTDERRHAKMLEELRSTFKA